MSVAGHEVSELVVSGHGCPHAEAPHGCERRQLRCSCGEDGPLTGCGNDAVGSVLQGRFLAHLEAAKLVDCRWHYHVVESEDFPERPYALERAYGPELAHDHELVWTRLGYYATRLEAYLAAG